MGALDDFLAGEKGVQPQDMSQPKTSGITDDLLDRLRIVEGGKEKFPINKQTKAMGPYQFMPDTVQMLHKQGYEFNPFNEEQARGAAKHYLEQLVKQNKGDVNKAVAQYGGHITADPTKYVNAVVGKQTETKPAQSTSALDDFLNQSQELGPPVKVQIAGTVKEEPKQIPQVPATQTPQEPSTLTKLGRTAAGLADTVIGGIQALPGAALAETGYAGVRALEGLGLAEPGRAERGREAVYKEFVEPFAKPVGQTAGVTETPEYKGEVSQQTMQFIGENLDKGADWISKKTGIPKADVQNMMNTLLVAAPAVGKNVKTVLKEQLAAKAPVAPKIEPTMQKPKVSYAELQQQLQGKKSQPFEMPMAGVGAARTADASTLAEAVARATPELKAELSKVKPGDLNVEALNRIMEADQLPVPIRYTKGQAAQDPVLISRERNERGIKEQYVERFNEQNKALQENANLMKERVAPDVNTTSFVEDAERSIDLMGKRIKTDDDAITAAYNSLKDYGAGKLEVDSQTFGNSAMKALREFDEQEFLPPSILNRIKDYTEGKAMNFNQFENLRTVLARETRKAQAANDGNAVHALTVVRSELEKMPLLNETGEAKVLADKARSLAKSQFDLLDKKRDTYNPLYADVMNGIADTKDFIPKLVFRSKNKDFVKTMETLSEGDPQAIQHLRSGALDYMIRESTDASGNFLTGKFNKLVDNLDVNKKLEPLFGEEAKTIRAIANAGKIIEARPKGAFVNESNTAVALGSMAKQYGTELAKRIPGVGAVIEPAQQILQQRKSAKEVKQTLKPAAGVRLSDIGKK